MRPKILLWHWGRRGGGPRYTFELARALAACGGVDVHLSWSRQSELAAATAELGLPSLPVDTYAGAADAALAVGLRLPFVRRRFLDYVARNGVDVVFCTMNHLWNVAVAPGLRRTGARYVLALHDALPHPGEENVLRAWALRRELAATDGVIALSRHVRRQLADTHRYPDEKITVLPHGAFSYGPATARRLDPDRPIRLCFFGRLLPYKGLDILLDAYELLRLRYGARVELTVAGSGDPGAVGERLARLPGTRLINRWIAEDEIAGILADADIVMLTYREASQSGVIPTACGLGLPVVATPVGGLTEQVIDGRTGRLAAAVSAEAAAEAAAALIDDPDAYARCSLGAAEFARDHLSWDAVARGYLDVAARLR